MGGVFDYESKLCLIDKLENTTKEENFWSRSDNQEIMEKLSSLKSDIELFSKTEFVSHYLPFIYLQSKYSIKN